MTCPGSSTVHYTSTLPIPQQHQRLLLRLCTKRARANHDARLQKSPVSSLQSPVVALHIKPDMLPYHRTRKDERPLPSLHFPSKPFQSLTRLARIKPTGQKADKAVRLPPGRVKTTGSPLFSARNQNRDRIPHSRLLFPGVWHSITSHPPICRCSLPNRAH